MDLPPKRTRQTFRIVATNKTMIKDYLCQKPKTTQDTDPVALIETAPQTKKSQTFEHVENDQTHPSLISPFRWSACGFGSLQ